MNPMLAGKLVDMNQLRFPVLASPKIDGIRLRVINGVAMSRSMKPLPNRFLQAFFYEHRQLLNGLDGEVVVGSETSQTVYNTTVSAIMSGDWEPDFNFLAFDTFSLGCFSFGERLNIVKQTCSYLRNHRVNFLDHAMIYNLEDLNRFETDMLECGYEGIMTRDPSGTYKNGRSSPKEQGLIKIKRFEDDEAVIIGMEELMHNGNGPTTNELGRTARSSHAENLVPMGTLGAFTCKGLTGPFAGVTFAVGTGFSAAQRAEYWASNPVGKVLTYKYFAVGVKDKPRHPVFKGFRPLI